MNKIKNVLICGVGAIGSIYAVKISENKNCNLKVLVDPERLEKYQKQPILFNGTSYVFDYITNDEKNFVADLIIIATKNNALPKVIEMIEPFISKNTTIISLLNGLSSEDELIKHFGKEKVLYSYYIGHTSTRVGRSISHDDEYKTVFGDSNNTVLSEKVLALKNFFDETCIKYEIPEDMDYAKWWKFLVNVGYNQASAVLNADYGVFQTHFLSNEIAIKLMEETVSIAKLEGVKNTEKMIPEVLNVIETMLPQTRTSMLQDIDAKRETEVDVFAGYVSKLGKKHGIQTPYNDVFYSVIKAIDEKNKNL